MASDDTYATSKRASDPKERAGNHFLPAGFCCCLITFFTILASSTRKARMILILKRLAQKKNYIEGVATYLDFTQSPQREPPYARRTVLMRFDTVAYLRGRRAGI